MDSTATPSTGVFGPATRLPAWAQRRGLVLVVALGLAIRVYLSLTNYCISGDGAAYIRMAREYAGGDWSKPLGAVFSPLYPLVIAAAHYFVSDWELAGNLVSTLMGIGAIVSVYLLVREVFQRDDLAIGSAALTAIHPGLAAYAASVRTEAGYIFLTTTAVWLILKARRENHATTAVAAGLAAGVAYLYRTEGIGLVFLCAAFPVAAALIWRDRPWTMALKLTLAFTLAALLLVVPYVIALHHATGHWSVGREFTAAMMYGMATVGHNTAAWRHRGFSAQASPLLALTRNPGLYVEKVGRDFLLSLYGFGAAEGPIPMLLLAAGLWSRGRALFRSSAETFLAAIVLFYGAGFTLSSTGDRFMIHLIPYTFGWVIIGLETLTSQLVRRAEAIGWRMPVAAPATLAVLIMLPQTLWPIGYDMRGVRYAGQSIARINDGHGAVAARDGRVAWYAGAPFVALPATSAGNLCDWLASRDEVAFILIGRRDEHAFALSAATSCVHFLKRYPRYGDGYYDLFAIPRAAASITNPTTGNPGGAMP